MKKALISIIGFFVIAVFVGCSSMDSSAGRNNELATGSQAGSNSSGGSSNQVNSGSRTGSQADNNSGDGGGNQASNASEVTPARPPVVRTDPAKTNAELVAEAIKWGIALFYMNIPKGRMPNVSLLHRQTTP